MNMHLADPCSSIPSGRAEITDFFQLTLDSLLAHIAILREDGTIIAVNAAWNAYATCNGLCENQCGPGTNYLLVCERARGPCSEESHRMARAIRDVSRGVTSHFQLEYPCHTPTRQMWFSVRVTRFVLDSRVHVVVTHDNVTERKIAELQLAEANRLLELQASTDSLTGAGNRRQFDRALEDAWERHTRSRSPLSVLLMDVDFFKKFNDARGHIAGDDCLKRVAGAIRWAVGRRSDIVARYGGEEFAAILPDTGREGASDVAGLIADGLRRERLPHPDSEVGAYVTLSIGAATIVPSPASSSGELLDRADRALYRAKADGRDRIHHADDAPLFAAPQIDSTRSRASTAHSSTSSPSSTT